ncbi:triacylglycerol lipase [Lachnoanaerobaculum sp. MSX33]|uniref:Mbeg1-like protein n=1 Tax=Lachnoanaerobaculum sp. MSX33 TaxID=936596 RepID=UPI0003DF99FE|nr:Mbeg1-like protein [Lachnoanaerobaculum sp. MSX33]ETO96393.1 triacylglycerol lipase [Lachnoanaerobaculum sp. MSX33]
MASNRPTDDELQEKALYDIIQYLPLDKLDISEFKNINDIVRLAQKKERELGEIEGKLDKESKSAQKAIEENLPAIEAILNDRPELGKAKISNMSWQDNDGDGNPDHNPKGMQACTFERDDQVYISFRGTPARSWIDNAKAFVKDMKKNEVIFNAYKIMMKAIDPTQQIGENTRNIIRGYIGMDYVFPWEKAMRGIEEKILDISEPKSNTTSEKGYGKFGAELRDYTSPMQEEALDYMESLKKSGVFEKYDNVYVTGHSKGGNEATLVTMVYSDVIDRCISGDGQGFSPEFVEYMKKTLGPEEFAKIQDKMYGFHANNDYVNVLGVSVIKVENRIYFIPEIKQESIIDLLWNHLPTAMIDVKTGKIAQVSEQGAFGKFIAKVNEKIMKLDPKDREDVAITGMAFMQYGYVFTFLTSSNPDKLKCVCESATDMIDVVASFGNGISMLKVILLETLLEKEGVELVGYLVDTFILKHIKEYFVYMLEYVKIDWDEFNRTLAKHNEQDIVRDKDLEDLKKYEVYGTSNFGTVAINYSKTKELVNILDEMNDLVEGRILPEMEDIAYSLRRLSFWRVNVGEWTDIKDSIEKNNKTRKIFKERVINYYNSCEIMEAKFVAGMYGGK